MKHKFYAFEVKNKVALTNHITSSKIAHVGYTLFFLFQLEMQEM